MKVLGITGQVGAGKSTILAYLEEKYRAKVIQADQVGAGSSLLTGRTITRFDRENGTSDTDISFADFRIRLLDCCHHRF